MTSILFVCLGNIIRSPLAENLFHHQALGAGLDGKYQLDSAGTAAYHVGEPPDPRMVRTAHDHGVEYTGQGRQVQDRDFEDFDLIVAMDRSNQRELLRRAPTPKAAAKVRLLREFDPEADDQDVPDPYYGGPEGFEITYEIVERSVGGLLESLEADQV